MDGGHTRLLRNRAQLSQPSVAAAATLASPAPPRSATAALPAVLPRPARGATPAPRQPDLRPVPAPATSERDGAARVLREHAARGLPTPRHASHPAEQTARAALLAPGQAAERRLHHAWSLLLGLLALAGFVALWNFVAWWGAYPEFILPRPATVLARFLALAADGTLLRHASLTAQEALGGFLIGLVFATLVGYPLAKVRVLEQVISPYLVASQSVPIVALAPLLVLWFGFGLTSKVLAASLIAFFPILVNVIVGVRSVDHASRELMRTLSASRWDVFAKLEVPAALPIYLGGMRVGITLSVIGAVVGEFVGADGGLGYMIAQSRGLFDTATLFVALLALMALALCFYGAVLSLERLLLAGRRRA